MFIDFFFFYKMNSLFYFFFFFQAEDGIRDGTVTGVQTCALPILADLPFGSYQASPGAALAAATRFLKETGAHAVKLEGGERVARQVEDLVAAGIPVMAHLGLTPQSVNAFGGYRVQGRGEDGE